MRTGLRKIVFDMHDMVPSHFGLRPHQLKVRALRHTQPSDQFYASVALTDDNRDLEPTVLAAAKELGAEVKEQGPRLALRITGQGIEALSRRPEVSHIFLEIPMTMDWRARIHSALTPA